MKNILLIFAFVYIFAACKNENYVNITGNLDTEDFSEIVIASIIEEVYDTIYFIKGQDFSHTMLIDEPRWLYLSYGNGRSYVYLQPGNHFNITGVEEGGRRLVFSGKGALENNFIYDFLDLMKQSDEKYDVSNYYRHKESRFLELHKEKHQPLELFMTDVMKNSKQLRFISLMQKNMGAMQYMEKLFYPEYYRQSVKAEPQLSADFYSFVSDININDEDYLAFEQGKALLRMLIERDLDFSEVSSIEEYFSSILSMIDKKVDDPKVSRYLKYNYLNQYIGNAGKKGVEEETAQFLTENAGTVMAERIEELVATWDQLEDGNQAPDFDGLTPEGKKVNLSELQGKYVYIDVWATWCGPCIAEIPSLKTLEMEYHGKDIVFLGVSIDQEKDREKWRKFIVDREIPGLQIMEDKDWSSEIAVQYNIKGIPRYILIDDKGKIVTANAPRPSNPEAKNLFNELGI